MTHARRFNGSSDFVNFSHGALTTFAYGTLAALVRRRVDSVWGGVIQVTATDDRPAFGLEISDANKFGLNISQTGYSESSSLTVTAADGWTIVVVTKATGTAAPTFWKYPIGGSWSSEAGGTSVADNTDTGTTIIGVGTFHDGGFTGDFLDGDIAVCALWQGTALSSGQVQTLDDSYATWAALSPSWQTTWAQTTVTTVNDDTAGGGNQSGISGTTVITTGPDFNGYDGFVGASDRWAERNGGMWLPAASAVSRASRW